MPAPPGQDKLAQHIAEILLAGYLASKAAELIHVHLGLIRPIISPLPSTEMILGIMRKLHTGTVPRTLGIPRTAVFVGHAAGSIAGAAANTAAAASKAARNAMRHAAQSDAYFRALFIVNAAKRVAKRVADGMALRKALNAEQINVTKHEAARRGRQSAAAKVVMAAGMFGDYLGWYLDPMLHNEAECIAANGHNFHASQGTIIGWPGAVHTNCGCSAGPPHEGARSVNEAVANARNVTLGLAKVYHLKRAG